MIVGKMQYCHFCTMWTSRHASTHRRQHPVTTPHTAQRTHSTHFFLCRQTTAGARPQQLQRPTFPHVGSGNYVTLSHQQPTGRDPSECVSVCATSTSRQYLERQPCLGNFQQHATGVERGLCVCVWTHRLDTRMPSHPFTTFTSRLSHTVMSRM